MKEDYIYFTDICKPENLETLGIAEWTIHGT
jgi:hypothetical protein